ncbi:hypothetical protein I3760_14G035900 [Carya illinoinensis]|nr:hypothetical protein I3760_14G035900 [Carya illinoinensis]
MAFSTSKSLFCFALVFAFATIRIVTAGDEDIISDFVVPTNFTPDDSYFTFTNLRAVVGAPLPTIFKCFYAILQYPAGSINPPHTHSRTAELLFLLGGALEVGFIDTTNKLFTQVLQTGDLFVFPMGLVHYEFNSDANSSALAISAFGSSFKTDVATIHKLKAGLAPKA